MKNNSSKLLLLNILYIAIIGFVVYKFAYQKPEATVNIPVPQDIYSGEVATSTPVRILIPKVGIDGKVTPVGKGVTGNMAVPVVFTDVGWYRYGPVPGQPGNAAMDGHVDNGHGKPGTFYNLKNVQLGDDVYVENSAGKKLHFKVTGMKLIDYANPTKEDIDEVFGKSLKERLNLITCEGTWIPEKKTYSNRLVVFTERVK